MRRPLRLVSLGFVAAALSACPTSFTGDAHFPGGTKGCQAKCQAEGLEMGAFVYAGAYSDACVCQPKSKTGAAGSTGGVSAGVIGVILQMQRMERERQASIHR